MIHELNHGHYQGISALCTPYAFTHAIESTCKELYPEYSPHTAPLSIAWRGYRGMGLTAWTGRSMAVKDILKGITEDNPITVRLTHPTKANKILTIGFFQISYELKPSIKKLQDMLFLGTVVATYRQTHSVCIVSGNRKGFLIYDPANPKKERVNVPHSWAKGVTEAYCILPKIDEV